MYILADPPLSKPDKSYQVELSDKDSEMSRD